MLTILLHTSKTMVIDAPYVKPHTIPAFSLRTKTYELVGYLQSLTVEQIVKVMGISSELATKTKQRIDLWDPSKATLPAIDIFLGDIYSGLQAQTFSSEDRAYAHEHLYILSGLYGVLQALDEIQPYRLEMGYKLLGNAHDTTQSDIRSLYAFWGDSIAQSLPKHDPIINLSAVEYTKAIFPYFKTIDGLKDVPVISPKFLTVSSKTGEPTFVTVHAKIARGAFARWLIQTRVEDLSKLRDFTELGYRYEPALSTPDEPVFVAQQFRGLGLSVRLSKSA